MEIDSAIEMALEGKESGLKVCLPDERLDSDRYKQIVTKIYAQIRFEIY